MARRETIKGRLGAGTNALFSSPADAYVMSSLVKADSPAVDTGMPVHQDAVLEADRETSVPDDQLGGSPVSPDDSVLAEQPAATPVSQQDPAPSPQVAVKPGRQSHRKQASQQASNAVEQEAAKPAELVKATFYLTPDLVMKLEEVRMARLRKGQRVDKSALVREALDQLAG